MAIAQLDAACFHCLNTNYNLERFVIIACILLLIAKLYYFCLGKALSIDADLRSDAVHNWPIHRWANAIRAIDVAVVGDTIYLLTTEEKVFLFVQYFAINISASCERKLTLYEASGTRN